MSVILRRAIIAELTTRFLEVKDDFLEGIKDYSHLVADNDTINFETIGALPTVLFNTVVNASNPIGSAPRTDDSAVVSLDKLDTTNTEVSDDELIALPYDKKSSVMADHVTALRLAKIKKALFNMGPASDTTSTPVFKTTGANDGTGRLRLTLADIIAWRLRLTNLGIDISTCSLILCPEHCSDIQLFDQSFRDRFSNTESGKIIGMLQGFKTFENMNNPKYNNSTFDKKAFGASAAGTDTPSSVFYSTQNAMKALGSVDVYISDAHINPLTRTSLFGARLRNIYSPVTTIGTGAIITG
jgi:hypothetical protein